MALPLTGGDRYSNHNANKPIINVLGSQWQIPSVTAGDKMFLSEYYAPYRKPLKTGDTISGKISKDVACDIHSTICQC